MRQVNLGLDTWRISDLGWK